MIFTGLLIPFAGTALGAAAVFLMKSKLSDSAQGVLSGFAGGVMIAASVWSLLIPSIDMSDDYALSFLPAAVGFALGMAFMPLIELVLGLFKKQRRKRDKSSSVALAVTLHNIPEGMAVGVAIAAALTDNSAVSVASAMALSTGIAIQNFPEGAIISMPLRAKGESRLKSFILGALSGAVEPVFGFFTIILTGIAVRALPYLLSCAAGVMIYVVINELVPEHNSLKEKYLCSAGFTLGFIVMMVMDVALG